MKVFSKYMDYIIATSIVRSEGKPFEALFFISRKIVGFDYENVHTERLGTTFAYGGDARIAANEAARAYVDSHHDC